MHITRRSILLCGALVFGASTALAGQLPQPATERPLSMSAVGGAVAGNGDAGGAAGLTFAYDLSERLAIEARGVYLDRGVGEMAADLTASLLVKLPTGRRALPYVAIGGGFYRAMFDVPVDGNWMDDPAWTGPGGSMMRGFGWHDTSGRQMFTSRAMPDFYARRMGDVALGRSGRHMQSFTDPAFTVGGGIDIALTDTLYARPDVRAVTVLSRGDALTIGTATFSIGYRF